jgi:2,3-dihydro-2,3-dihydroxybenzoate dehydrogenase
VAGVLYMNALESISEQEWQQTLNTNVSGALWLFQQVIPWFKAQRHGAIVTVSSNANHAPRMGMGSYSASKAALTNLTMTAGIELAPYGVRCNVVSPGSTDTQMQRQLWQDDQGEQKTIHGFPEQFKLGIPLGKIAQPRDIAYCVAFLASDWANHVTLQDLVVDGGATLGA